MGTLHPDENAVQSILRVLRQHTGESFDVAWEQMRRHNNPKPFVLKCAGISVGAVLMGDGIYNFYQGCNEQVEDALLSDKEHRNLVRMFVGAGELAAGATALYMGLTKSGIYR